MWMDKNEHEQFDRELVAGDPTQVSRGTKGLMAVMGIRAPNRPPGRPADGRAKA